MTVTIVYGKTSDGYIHSYDASYSTSRNGPADAVNGGTALYIGQNNNASQYATFEAFVGYDYSAIPATDVVVAAELRLYMVNALNASLAQDVEWRGYAWSSGGLVVGDWRTPSQLSAARLDGLTHITGSAKSQTFATSSDELLNAMKSVASMEHVVTTSRMRAGTTPTSDEGYALSSADESGTSFDPSMVYTSVQRSTLFGVLGAQVEVSNGYAYLQSDGAATPVISLRFMDWAGNITVIGNLPIGTATNQFSVPGGYQAFALVADEFDNLFVLSKYSQAENTLAYLCYKKGAGTTWSATQMRSTAMPTFGTAINQVAAFYTTATAGGSIFAIVSHIGSAGDSVVHNELSHAVLNTSVLINNQTTVNPTRMSGYSIPSLQPIENAPSYFNTWHNQTGTGLDAAGPVERSGNSDWGYVYSFGTVANLGDNRSLNEGRFILNSTATAFSHTSTEDLGAWGRKDAGGKVRIIPVSQTAAAFVSADSDAGYGITICVQNHNGSNAGSTEIGYVAFSDEGLANMPDGPALGAVPWWDAIYSAVENSIWVYYVSAVNPRQIYRTSFNLNTMRATGVEVLVRTTDVGNTIQAVRVQRNAAVGQDTLLCYAVINGSNALSFFTYIDHFNIAPNAPTLTTRANFDASASATFAWTFNDPNPGDTQSAYQLEISNSSTGVVVLDTGKTASTTSSRAVAGGTIPNGADYRWRVRTWDALDVQGPYSGYGTFTASAGGSVTITSPATDYPDGVVTDDIPISWNVTGTTQAAYRIWLYRGATVVSDTGWIASTATAATVAGMLTDQAHEIRLQVRNASAVTTNTASRFVTPSYSTPEKPLLTVQPQPSEGYVLVVIENPAPGAPTAGFPEEGFESGVGTWGPSTGASFTQDTTVFHRGAASGKLTVTTAGQTQYYVRDYTNRVPVVPGQRYTARMWLYRSVAGNVSPSIDWADGSFAYLSTSGNGVVIPANTWTLVDVTGTAPAGAAWAAYGPTMGGSPALGVSLNADEIVLTTASDRPDVSGNTILRRAAGTDDPFEVVGTTGPDGSFRDYTATANLNYEYVARGNA